MTNVTVHEALKQAIEQLEVSWTICTDEDYMEGFRNAANLCKAALAELDKCEPELYMAKNLHNKSYATSHSEAEARLFLLQSGLKVDGIESEVISLCRCDTSPQPCENAPTVQREGWVSVEDRLPEKYTEVIVYPPPTDYCITAQYGKFSRSIENDTWYYGEYLAGYGHENNSCKVTHWQPLPAAPTDTE